MKIVEVRASVFRYTTRIVRDSDGHGHPGAPREARNALLTITADDGVEGHVIAPPSVVTEDLLAEYLRPVLVGADPLADRAAVARPL